MRRNSLILAALLLCAAVLYAQQSAPPDVLTPQTAASVAFISYKAWAEGQFTSLWSGVTQLQTSTAKLPQDEATIQSLQAAVQAQGVLIQNLQAQLAAQKPPAPTCPSQILFTGLANGPITGVYQCVTFSANNWVISNAELAPAADGQPGRSITFPRAVTITSITFSTTTAATPGIIITSSTGQQVTAQASGINQDTTFAPGFVAPVTSFTVGGTAGTATDLRIRSISFM